MARFKARARTLDLLGRQQIAGIPTAINELFKNAHDAYADNVDVDYIRRDKLFILRDNGLGMTRDDFESRWLTLGTESKYTNSKIPAPPKDETKQERPIMGEKGIGRLAIASIGSQMLVLTRANRKNETHKIVAAFINWSVFELPNINLEDIIIPIKEFETLPNSEELDSMKEEFILSLLKLAQENEIEKDDANQIISTVRNFCISPLDINKKLVGNFELTESGFGTHFYINPVDESLNSDIDGEKDKTVSTKMEKMLLGFTNIMTPNHPKPQITVAFRDYKSDDGTYNNIFDKQNFFTPEDFSIADHHFEGVFDEYGQFQGKINIYREKEFEHKIPWGGNNYNKTSCGAFSINVAYIQGELKQSIIDSENYNRIKTKTDKHGGLYLYKDNIRILPYGNSDYDWLDVERNRTKSASYYFFSFRRMFGVIDISKKRNDTLKEKAGREGFIENKAYRQFREILMNFFTQLAADFFREGSTSGPKAEFWATKRAERESFYSALKKNEEKARGRKDKFQVSLNHFFDNLEKNKYKQDIKELLNNTRQNFENIAYINNPDESSQAILDLETKSRKLLNDYILSIKVNQPRGFTISKYLKKDYEAYLIEFEKLQNTLFNGALDSIDLLVEEYTLSLKVKVNKRKRLEEAVSAISSQAEKATRQKQKEAKEALAEVTKNVSELARELMINLENKVRDIKDDFKKLEINNSGDFDLVKERTRMEVEILSERDKATFALESIIKQLQEIYWTKDSDGLIITSDQITDAITEELGELRERVQADIELSQLGLAVGVIHHEFNSTVNSIRNSIKDLKAWSDVNEKLEGVYNNIRINFEHLDGYLTLFTPLNRRLYRNKENISTSDIKAFLLDLFGARLERHNIQLLHTKGFLRCKLNGYRSTFYPVFVNLIDNAIHWLNQSPEQEKRIVLHADNTGFYISNNGVTIPLQDAEKIFDLGFTRKLNGRGMGLHISREVLNAEDYNIFLASTREGLSVTFKIEPKTK